MKNRIGLKYFKIAIALLIFCNFTVQGQSISQERKVFVWMKTWNFLKYYHPAFAGGDLEADSFFRAKLPSLAKIDDWNTFNGFLLKEIRNIRFPASKDSLLNPLSEQELLKLNPLHKWYLRDPYLSKSLKQQLLEVFNHRDPLKQHYVPRINYETEIPNERVYDFPDAENLPVDLRLLALAKLQGVMDYLYPHQDLMPETSDQVILQNIPRFEQCASRKEYEILLLKIVANFRDTHAYNRFYEDLKFKKEIFNNTFYPPFDYEVLGDEILVTRLIFPEICASAGIQTGDLIKSINGKSISTRINELSQLLSASNRNVLVYKLNNYSTNFMWSNTKADFELTLRSGGIGKTIRVKFVSGYDQKASAGINRYFQARSNEGKKEKAFQILEGDIAYFKIGEVHQFVQEEGGKNLDQIMDSVLTKAAEQKGMVFDMRGYPGWGGLVYHYLFQKFSRDDNNFGQYKMADLNHLGTFKLNREPSTYNAIEIKPQRSVYTGKVIILVNGATLSLSEWQTMSLQHIFPQSITIGTQTAGADGDEKMINIPGNYKVNFTGNAIYYPDGTPAQGKGIKINQVVIPQISDLLNGTDTILNQAIQLIH